MKIRNVILGLKDQLPLSRLLKNIISWDIYGLIHIRSHERHDGKPKVMYNTKETAKKAAISMQKKQNSVFSTYKCFHCDGYHIGKNRPAKTS